MECIHWFAVLFAITDGRWRWWWWRLWCWKQNGSMCMASNIEYYVLRNKIFKIIDVMNLINSSNNFPTTTFRLNIPAGFLCCRRNNTFLVNWNRFNPSFHLPKPMTNWLISFTAVTRSNNNNNNIQTRMNKLFCCSSFSSNKMVNILRGKRRAEENKKERNRNNNSKTAVPEMEPMTSFGYLVYVIADVYVTRIVVPFSCILYPKSMRWLVSVSRLIRCSRMRVHSIHGHISYKCILG